MIHEAAFRKLFDERAVRAAMTGNGRQTSTCSTALELNAAGSAGTERARRPLPRLTANPACRTARQHQGPDIEVDFHWPSLNLVVEVDGPGHTRPRTKREDHERDASLRAAGHTVLRVLDHEIDHRPETVASSLLSAARPA